MKNHSGGNEGQKRGCCRYAVAIIQRKYIRRLIYRLGNVVSNEMSTDFVSSLFVL